MTWYYPGVILLDSGILSNDLSVYIDKYFVKVVISISKLILKCDLDNLILILNIHFTGLTVL